jgi:hypothetical protein
VRFFNGFHQVGCLDEAHYKSSRVNRCHRVSGLICGHTDVSGSMSCGRLRQSYAGPVCVSYTISTNLGPVMVGFCLPSEHLITVVRPDPGSLIWFYLGGGHLPKPKHL